MMTPLLKTIVMTVCATALVSTLRLQAQPDGAYGTYNISFNPGFGATESYGGPISGTPSGTSWNATGGPGGLVNSAGGGATFDVYGPGILGIGVTTGSGVGQSAPGKGGFNAATLTFSWNVYFNIGSAGFGYGGSLADLYQLYLGGNVGPAGSYVSASGTATFSDSSGTIASQWGSKATVSVGFSDSSPGLFTDHVLDENYPLAGLPANDLVNVTGSLTLKAYDPAGDSGIELTSPAGPVPAPEPSAFAGSMLATAGLFVAFVISRRRKYRWPTP